MPKRAIGPGPLRIGVVGCGGKVGRLLVDEIQSPAWAHAATLSGGVTRSGQAPSPAFLITHSVHELASRCDALIDFTNPACAVEAAQACAQEGIALVTGTTGLDSEQERILRKTAKFIPIVYAANMSVGVTLLAALVEQAAARLGPEWDAEILETHHHRKIDAPSGTALMLGRSVAIGRDVSLDNHADWARHGQTGPRTEGNIGFAVRRGGDVVGEHTVGFYGEGERVEFTHVATNRRLFARGAIRASLWVATQPPGLYSMRDVLGLNA